MFGFEVTTFYELQKDGSYSQMGVIIKDNTMYCISSTNFHHIGAAPGSQWEIITKEEEWSECIASSFVSSPEELFVPLYEYTPTGVCFSSFEEMKKFWNENSVQVGSRRSSQGIELVFAIP